MVVRLADELAELDSILEATQHDYKRQLQEITIPYKNHIDDITEAYRASARHHTREVAELTTRLLAAQVENGRLRRELLGKTVKEGAKTVKKPVSDGVLQKSVAGRVKKNAKTVRKPVSDTVLEQSVAGRVKLARRQRAKK